MKMLKSFDVATLTRLREMAAGDALALLAIHVKADPTYVPLKADHSRRWHVSTTHGEFELLTTGPSGTTREHTVAAAVPSIWRCTSLACRLWTRSST